MKTIKEIQEYNRKKIIYAVHNTDDYEEALEKELGKGCLFLKEDKELYLVEYKDDRYNTLHARNPNEWLLGTFWHKEELFKKYCKIIGKPLTLSRVLLALNERSDFRCSISGREIEIFGYIWDLEKETLEEQIEYLQRGVYKLLGGDV